MTKEEAMKSLAKTKVYVGEHRKKVIIKLIDLGLNEPCTDVNITGLRNPEFLYISDDGDFVGGKKLEVFFSHGYKQICMSEILDIQIDSEFKDGDVLASERGCPFIFNGQYDLSRYMYYYVGVDLKGLLCEYEDFIWTRDKVRFATEEESTKLFKALSDAGKRWNAEKKCIEDLPKLFKPFDKVLMRGSSCPNWICCLYSHVEDVQYVACGGTYFTQCIPFEGNEHLLGTI